MLLILLFLVAGLWFWPGGHLAQMPPGSLAPLPPLPEVRLPYFPVPDNLTLCGEAVPLQEPAVKEALDREFTVIVWSRAQTPVAEAGPSPFPGNHPENSG